MSYKVETEKAEHEALLARVMADWSRQEHDVHLVSNEGHKIFSHKVILSFYSNILNEILSDPVISLSPQPVTILIPASISTLATLLDILVKGKAEAKEVGLNEDIKEVARTMGIELKKCFVGSKTSLGIGLAVSMNHLNKPETTYKTFKQIPKPLKIVSNSVRSLTQSSKSLTSKKSVLPNNFNTSVIKKSSGQTIELKEFIKEKTTATVSNDETLGTKSLRKRSKFLSESGKFKCDVCFKEFIRAKGLYKHRAKVHKIRRRPAPSSESSMLIVKDEKPDFSSTRKNQSVPLKYQCDICEKCCKDAQSLRKHKLIHLPDSEKPYSCDICGKRFCQTGQRKVHMRRYHEKPEETSKTVESDTFDFTGIVDETITMTNDDMTGLDNSQMPTDDKLVCEDGSELAEANVVLETRDI